MKMYNYWWCGKLTGTAVRELTISQQGQQGQQGLERGFL
jgi:hypothetical protein